MFSKLSANQYTVYGLSPQKNVGLSIEHRHALQSDVLEFRTGRRWTLPASAEWIAYHLSSNGNYGARGIGSTPKEAYLHALESLDIS